jgi:hypothetical protein
LPLLPLSLALLLSPLLLHPRPLPLQPLQPMLLLFFCLLSQHFSFKLLLSLVLFDLLARTGSQSAP